MAPVQLLKERGTDVMVCGGMGMRPLSGFQSVGIAVHYREQATTVREAVEGMIAGTCRSFGEEHTCGGGGDAGGCGGHHHHHHQQVEREEVDGPIEKDRVVHMSYEVREQGNDEVLDQSAGIHYLHGRGGLVPGIEEALEGELAGSEHEITVTPEDGYGERDEERVVEVPANLLPPDLQPGDVVQAQHENGTMLPMTFVGIEGDTARLDANHPLAGKTLEFRIKVIKVLAAHPSDLA